MPDRKDVIEKMKKINNKTIGKKKHWNRLHALSYSLYILNKDKGLKKALKRKEIFIELLEKVIMNLT